MSLRSLLTLPSHEEVADNLEHWKQFHSKLGDLVSKIETTRESQSVAEMREMFDQYVAPKYPRKQFNSFYVFSSGEDSKTITYNHDGVSMHYLGRMTWCIDDYDYFIDRKIIVNGVTILDKQKM